MFDIHTNRRAFSLCIHMQCAEMSVIKSYDDDGGKSNQEIVHTHTRARVCLSIDTGRRFIYSFLVSQSMQLNTRREMCSVY